MAPFPVLTRIVFGYSNGFYFCLVLTRILPFLGTHIDWTFPGTHPNSFLILARILLFLGTHPDSTIFLVPTLIGPFSGTYPNSFWILARILPFPGTRPDSIIFQSSHRFDPFPVHVGIAFGHSHGFYLFPVLARILLLFGTPTDSNLFRYSSGKFLATRTDSTFSRYSSRSEERRVGKECRSRWSPYH